MPDIQKHALNFTGVADRQALRSVRKRHSSDANQVNLHKMNQYSVLDNQNKTKKKNNADRVRLR